MMHAIFIAGPDQSNRLLTLVAISTLSTARNSMKYYSVYCDFLPLLTFLYSPICICDPVWLQVYTPSLGESVNCLSCCPVAKTPSVPPALLSSTTSPLGASHAESVTSGRQ